MKPIVLKLTSQISECNIFDLLTKIPDLSTISKRSGSSPPCFPAMARVRIYQDLQKLADLLEFEDIDALKAWMASRLVKPYWDEYNTNYLSDSMKKTGKKGGKFQQVVKALAAGESGGGCFYSEDYPPMTNWTGIDHQARLLFKVVRANRENRNGIFFRKQIPEGDMQGRIWQVILRKQFEVAPSRVATRTENETGEMASMATATADTLAPTIRNPKNGQIRAF